jgi:hypothetical protein
MTAGVAFDARAASANNWYGATGATGCGGNMQDNSTLTYNRSGVGPVAMRDAINWALTNRIEPTDISVAVEQAAANGSTDVVYFESNYVNSFCGFTWHSAGTLLAYTSCKSLSGSRCDRFDVLLDQSWEIGATTTLRQNLATHETGHALGLQHPVGGVPASTVMGDWPNVSQFDGPHEVTGHINTNY